MNNLLDYITWRGDLSFTESPFNEVDNAVLSAFSYVRLADIVPEDGSAVSLKRAHELYYARKSGIGTEIGAMMSPQTLTLFDRMASSRRFGRLFLSGLRDTLFEGGNGTSPEQFAALTILLPDETQYIVFRGTDDTLAGWKEDLFLTMQESIPSQRHAAAYFLWAAEQSPGSFMLGGHSKGGNLAVYAAAEAPPELQARILKVWNNDGPGFHDSFISREGYQAVSGRIFSLKPEYSIIGGFFRNLGSVTYVRTEAFGFSAHTCFAWDVRGTAFVPAPGGLHPGSRIFDSKMEEALSGLDNEQRRRFIGDLFDALREDGSETVTDITRLKLPQLAGVVRSVTKGAELQHFLRALIELYLKDLKEFIRRRA